MNATTSGTERLAARFLSELPADHFRKALGLSFSSIGLGTYLGEMDSRTDNAYEEAIKEALLRGCNVIDAAINYRFQRSERNIGSAVKSLIAEKKIARDEIILSTKGGFLTFDEEYPKDAAKYYDEELFQKGVCAKSDIVAGCHCMTPGYLENQLDKSLRNLGVDCIDVYFIHNPETQLNEVPRPEFNNRLRSAFESLEKKVQEGKIQYYGAATWDGFRSEMKTRSYLSLQEMVDLAKDVAGEQHHFRVIQLPFNLAMPEALVLQNQKSPDGLISVLEAAENMDLVVYASASILQGRLSRNLPKFIMDVFSDFKTDAQRSIQFVRSAPGITTSLVGMSSKSHVEENLAVAKHPPLPLDRLKELFEAG